MGRAIIVLVVASGIIFSFAGINMTVTNKDSVDNAVDNYENNVARGIAKSGIDFCISKLDSNRNWRTGYSNLSIQGGTLSASLSSVDLERVRIETRGHYADKDVKVTCIVRMPGTDLPEAFDYALASDGAMTMNGTVDIVMDNPSLPANASIHSNTSIYVGTQVRVAGYGTSSGNMTCNPISNLPNVFEPNYNPYNQPDYQTYAPTIPIPDFNADSYKAIANEVHEGDWSISGNATVGSTSTPRIIWIGGNLTLSGGVNLLGAGIYVVKGDITISGNVTINGGVNNLSNLAFYSQNTITINGNPSVEGQFYARNRFIVNGNATITGSAVVKNNDIPVTTVSGSATIRYRPGNPALTSPIFTNNPRPQLCSYWE